MQRRNIHFESLENRELLAGDLRIVEINYNPHAAMPQYGDRNTEADDFEFIELMNVGTRTLNLRDYQFTQGVTFEFRQQLLDPGARIVITKDIRDFQSRYGNGARIALGNDGDGGRQGEYQGSLRNSGETLVLRSPFGSVAHSLTYFDRGEWPDRADGMGSSLELINVRGDANDPKNWQASGEFGGSPGQAGRGMRGEVVINELLTHTDLPQIDSIELYNRTDDEIDMSRWFLSDSVNDLFRYRLAGPNSVIDADDYLVLDENQLGFSFRGQTSDNAFIIETSVTGRPIRFVDAVKFGATQNGVSLGRWDNGEGELFPMSELTFGEPNSGPLIEDFAIRHLNYAPILISEVHYHPSEPTDGLPIEQHDLEFIEIYNQGDVPVDLSHWRLSSAVDFEFPLGTILSAETSLVVIGFHPDFNVPQARALRDYYNIPEEVKILGGYSDVEDPNPDQLDDNGEVILLERPEDIEQLGLGYVLVDRVTYSDAGDWPRAADGQGRSLTRTDLLGYGDAAASWSAAIPTPGVSGLVGDFDVNGEVDARDIDLLCAASHLGGQNAFFDVDRDGAVSRADVDYLIEEILGTVWGDANLDGVFDSSDLVQVFRAGQYEDGVRANSGWAAGDWNCDREFDSSDLVVAFRAGGYEEGNVAASIRGLTHSDLNLDDEDDIRKRRRQR